MCYTTYQKFIVVLMCCIYMILMLNYITGSFFSWIRSSNVMAFEKQNYMTIAYITFYFDAQGSM
jgi:hypothetical protein